MLSKNKNLNVSVTTGASCATHGSSPSTHRQIGDTVEAWQMASHIWREAADFDVPRAMVRAKVAHETVDRIRIGGAVPDLSAARAEVRRAEAALKKALK